MLLSEPITQSPRLVKVSPAPDILKVISPVPLLVSGANLLCTTKDTSVMLFGLGLGSLNKLLLSCASFITALEFSNVG